MSFPAQTKKIGVERERGVPADRSFIVRALPPPEGIKAHVEFDPGQLIVRRNIVDPAAEYIVQRIESIRHGTFTHSPA